MSSNVELKIVVKAKMGWIGCCWAGKRVRRTEERERGRWREMTTFSETTAKTEAEQIGIVQTHSFHMRGYKTDVLESSQLTN